jgi:hypothetical protein
MALSGRPAVGGGAGSKGSRTAIWGLVERAGFFRPVGALLYENDRIPGLTPLAINGRPFGAQESARCVATASTVGGESRRGGGNEIPAPTGPESIARGVSPW